MIGAKQGNTMEDFEEIWVSVEALRTTVAAGYVKPNREEQATLTLGAEIDRLGAELNALDKALRCEGWTLEARVERANALAVDGTLLAWMLAHPETCAEVLLDAAAGEGEVRALLEQRRAGLAASGETL